MNYYSEIKDNLVNNEVYKRVKDYSKNRSDLNTYYDVGKLLSLAGKHYGEGIIKEYSKRLTNELGKKYNERTLRRFKQFYEIFNLNTKWSAMTTKLTWSHYVELLSLKDINEINYYIELSIENNLSYRELHNKIKENQYNRLSSSTKKKIIEKNKLALKDSLPNPILINNKSSIEVINEKILHQLILENISSFLEQLGVGYSFIKSEYKIKIGDRYNYIDLLLYNIEFNCYVVVELKVTELKKEHIGQIGIYMNDIDSNLKKINQDKTIGIIICKKNNQFVMEYCSDSRILSREYKLNVL
jgi:predicted nuclease of restriction endonuclease-like (RecB) superfamily